MCYDSSVTYTTLIHIIGPATEMSKGSWDIIMDVRGKETELLTWLVSNALTIGSYNGFLPRGEKQNYTD